MNLAPVNVSPVASEPMVVNCVAYGKNGVRLPDITLDQISDVLEMPESFVWVGLHEPDEALLELGPSYGLYAVFDFIVDNFQPIVEAFQGELAALESAIFEGEFKRDTV